LALFLPVMAAAQASQPANKPTQSAHRLGRDGLEGWTLESRVLNSGYGDERFAFTLVCPPWSHHSAHFREADHLEMDLLGRWPATRL
jgi:hypothetical protein